MTRRPALTILLGALIVTASSILTPASAQTAVKPTAVSAAPADKPSLYKRLGGYDAIAAVTDDFIGRLLTDPRFAKFFVGVSTDSRGKIRQHVVDQLCNATGGPCVYTGRTMKQSHAGLGITEEDWNAAVQLLIGSLDKFKVPETEKKELLTIAGTLKADIVEKK